jgi:DNA-directed RNA polymerase subunit RPC12/RpoP
MIRTDFSEVGHTGGKATFSIRCDEEGRVSYQIGYSHSSPRPMRLVGVYAHPDGFACGNIVIGGIGQPWNPPPLPNCIAVFMASDSHGKFGHECPDCKKHFRTDSIPSKFQLTCPYCGLRAESYHFLTPPQQAYIKHYVESLKRALLEVPTGTNTEVVIDMNAIADSVTDEPRPDFYYTSTTQKTEFKCVACNSYNDIRGRYGYCASCGWRNTAESQKVAQDRIREQINGGVLSASDAVKHAVSEFDSAARDFADQLVTRIPMKESRSKQFEGLLFHNLDKFDELMKTCFDIDLLKGMDRDFVRMMFFRRHVYEHDGGVATKRYVENSGDTQTAEGVLIRETIENAHKFIGCLNRMIEALEKDFHEIFKPEPFCIDIENERNNRMRKRNA